MAPVMLAWIAVGALFCLVSLYSPGFAAPAHVGTLIIGVLEYILNLSGVVPYVQQLFIGALIVVSLYVMSLTYKA